MAQDFERAVAADGSGDVDIGTTARTILTSNSDDALVGIRLTNIHASAAVKADVYILPVRQGVRMTATSSRTPPFLMAPH